MYTRKENFDGAKQFFIEFLKIFNCRNIKIEKITINDKIYFVCGFFSYNSKICSSISSIFPGCKFNHRGNYYIVSVEAKAVKDKLNLSFQITIDKLSLRCGGFIRENIHYITDDKYQSLCQNIEVKNILGKAGLGLREESLLEEKYDFHMPIRYEAKIVKMIAIDGYSSYKKFIFSIPDATIENVLYEQAKKMKTREFCLHLHCGNSPSLPSLKENELFDKNLVAEVFSFDLVDTPKHELINWFSFFNNEEKKESVDLYGIQHNITEEEQEIREHIDKLVDEAGCSISNTKKSKIDFLELLLAYKRVHPNWSLKLCLKFAKENEPALYDGAISGIFWTRTKELLGVISVEQRPVMQQHLSLHRWKM